MSDSASQFTDNTMPDRTPWSPRTDWHNLSGEQDFVYLDVGGSPFKMLRQTVYNRPDSLIAKVLTDCPNSAQEKRPLYIDRNPKTFEWILEVYRNGDIEGSMPQVSTEYLQRELDFYQLPSLEDLGLGEVPHASAFAKEIAVKNLMQEIVKEIMESGVKDLFPWFVYVYHEFTKSQRNPQRRIFVCPVSLARYLGSKECKFIIDRGHETLSRALAGRGDFDYYSNQSRFDVLSKGGGLLLTIQLPTHEMIGLIEEEARSVGMLVQARNKWYQRTANKLCCPIFYLSWLE